MQIKLLSVYCLPWFFPASTPVLIPLKAGESLKNERFAFHMQNTAHREKHKPNTQELRFATLQGSTCLVTLLDHCTDEQVDNQVTDFTAWLKKTLSARHVQLTCQGIYRLSKK